MTATFTPSRVEVVRSARHSRDLRVRRRLVALGIAVVTMFFVDVLLGSYTVTISDFVRILAGEDIAGASFILMEDKLPRAVIGLFVGVSFGVSGAILQTMLRNPLASPDIIGVTAGASALAVFAIVVLGAAGTSMSWFALGGAGIVALLIHMLARHDGVTGQRLILVGIGVAAMLQAATSYLLTRSDLRTASEVLVWLNGSLNNSTWQRALILIVSLAVLLALLVFLSGAMSGLELGDDTAAAIGVPVERSRLGLLLVCVALSGVATAAAGPVAFIAFLAGPIVRRLLRGEPSLIAAGLVGALIVLGAEFVAANLIPGTVLPVGVITGALGAPFLLWLLVATNRVGRGG